MIGILRPVIYLRPRTDTGFQEHGVNIAGFMIGNGCPGWDVVTCTPYSCGGGPGKAPVSPGDPPVTPGICSGGGTEVAVDFRYGHGLASQPTYANYVANCADQRAAKELQSYFVPLLNMVLSRLTNQLPSNP